MWFTTLTYAPEHLPTSGTLIPRHLTLFLKRLRKTLPFRYYAVGEYGSKTNRPHYHALLFTEDRLDVPEAITAAWQLGLTHTGLASPEGMQYVAGYTLKKLTSWKETHPGLEPEFARMSRMPGIGAGAVPSLASAINTDAATAEIAERGDVPYAMRLAGHILPLGRFVRTRYRVEAGYPETDPSYRLLAMLNRPILTTEERAAARRESLAKARNLYRNKARRTL